MLPEECLQKHHQDIDKIYYQIYCISSTWGSFMMSIRKQTWINQKPGKRVMSFLTACYGLRQWNYFTSARHVVSILFQRMSTYVYLTLHVDRGWARINPWEENCHPHRGDWFNALWHDNSCHQQWQQRQQHPNTTGYNNRQNFKPISSWIWWTPTVPTKWTHPRRIRWLAEYSTATCSVSHNAIGAQSVATTSTQKRTQ